MGNEADMDATRKPERLYSIGELAELTGVSRRTVHFYVQRRLIDPPLGRGRGRHYDQRHVEQIRRVRALQRQGVPLDDMAAGGLARTMPQADAAEPLEVESRAALRPGVAAEPPGVQPVVRVRIDQNVTVEVAQAAATPELVAALVASASAVVSEYRGRSETGVAAGRRPQGATAGPAPTSSSAGAGAEPAPTPSPGPGAHRSEPEDKEEP
jgi:hypothetical protein